MHLHNQSRALIVAGMNTRVQQKEATRASILQAALEEFSEKGFDGTSTRLIAAKAGVHHALIKYHFQSKDALWKAAVTLALGPVAWSRNGESVDETVRPWPRR